MGSSFILLQSPNFVFVMIATLFHDVFKKAKIRKTSYFSIIFSAHLTRPFEFSTRALFFMNFIFLQPPKNTTPECLSHDFYQVNFEKTRRTHESLLKIRCASCYGKVIWMNIISNFECFYSFFINQSLFFIISKFVFMQNFELRVCQPGGGWLGGG